MNMRFSINRRLVAALLTTTGALAAPFGAPRAADAGFDMRADWRSYLEVLKNEHDNPFFLTPEARFRAEQELFEADAPALTRAEQIVRFAQLTAMVGDGHTFLPMHPLPIEGLSPGPSFRPLPVRFELFDDGLFIVGAIDDYKNLIGAEIVSIGSVSTDVALQQVMMLLPRDAVNFSRELAPEWLMLAETLAALDMADSADSIDIGYVKNGQTGNAALTPLSPEYRYDWIFSMDGGPSPATADAARQWNRGEQKTPLWRETFEGNHRVLTLKNQTFYFQINEIRGGGAQTLAQAAADIAGRASGNARVIIDLRLCVGGNGLLIPEMIAALQRLQPTTKIAVLTSRKTHSAGVMLVSALEQQTHAVFIGQATADRPNHFGETNIFVLPDSQLPVLYASEYYQTSAADDVRPFRSPDIPVPYLSEDYVRGFDRTLETALAYLKRK